MVRPAVAVVLVALVLVAGCSGNRSPEPITDAAATVSVNDQALATTGYGNLSADRPRFTTSGQTSISGDVQMNLRYQFNATTSRTIYRNENTPSGVFAVWTVPLIEPKDVALTVNPLRDMSTASVVTQAQGRYQEVTSLESAGSNLTVSMLGTDVTVARFTATASVDGSTTDVRLAVASVTHNGDKVVAVFISQTGADAATIRTLLGGIRH